MIVSRPKNRNHSLKIQDISLCPGSSICEKCFFFKQKGGSCSGCKKKYHQRCLKRACFLDCSICSGGKHSLTWGCCGRAPSPQLTRVKKILCRPSRRYIPEPLKIENRFIPVIHSISKLNIPEEFPEIDTWAVPIHKVMNLSGAFRSTDLKDYLGLPADRKLILSTCAPDSYQELLWEKGADWDYKKHHIDYWFPAHFSIYDHDSKLYQFISAKRQQLHAALTASQFVWFRLGENIPLDFLAPIKKAPSVLISTGQMYSPENRELLNKEFKLADRWFPKTTSFFIIGETTWLSVPAKRSCFDIGSHWLIRGIKGRDLNGNKVENRSKRDVLISNLKNTLKTINTLYI